MEAELLTVLGRIPAPDDRDLATQLTSIERSVYACSLEVALLNFVHIGAKIKSCRQVRSSFRKGDLSSPDSRPS